MPFISTYKLLFGAFPTPSEPGLGYDIQTRDKSIMYLSGPKLSLFFLYRRLLEPTKEHFDYSGEDIQALAQQSAEYPLTERVKAMDV